MHWFLRLGVLGTGIGAISHETSYEVIVKGRSINKAIPGMPKTCYKIVNPAADIILRMTSEITKKRLKKGRSKLVESRVLLTQESMAYDAGDRTKTLPARIYFKTEKEAVDKILECFAQKGG